MSHNLIVSLYFLLNLHHHLLDAGAHRFNEKSEVRKMKRSSCSISFIDYTEKKKIDNNLILQQSIQMQGAY